MSGDLFLFFVGLACAIPFSIAANMLTPRFEQWWVRRNEKAALRLKVKVKEEYLRVRLFHNDPNRFNRYAIAVVTSMVFGVFIFVFMCTFLILIWLIAEPSLYQELARLVAVVIITALVIMMNNQHNRIHAIYHRLNDFEAYEKEVRMKLGNEFPDPIEEP